MGVQVLALALGIVTAHADSPIQIDVIGGLAGITQYTQLEKPFWDKEIEALSGGHIQARVRPLDSGGFRGQEMLQLMRMGVVPFGTALLSVVAGDEPVLNVVDLPVLNPDIDTLQRTLGAMRGDIADLLLRRYNIELLGVYTYPAQVLFCDKSFTGLGDIKGRRVRTSSVGQSELVSALGGIAVQLPFAGMVDGFRTGIIDCAITGTLSGYEIGLPTVTTHVHSFAISWGLSIFGANIHAWQALSPEDRQLIRDGVAALESRIWQQAGADTERGLACATGKPLCGQPYEHAMVRVSTSQADVQRRRQLLEQVVLPRWIDRCGPECAQVWNHRLAAVHQIRVPE